MTDWRQWKSRVATRMAGTIVCRSGTAAGGASTISFGPSRSRSRVPSLCLVSSTVFRLEWLIPVADGTQQVRQIDDVLGDNMGHPALLLEASTTPDHS